MSHIDFNMGVFYPQGGIYKITEALAGIAKKNGAELKVNSPVAEIIVDNWQAVGVKLENGKELHADIVISNADIEHTETKLLGELYRERSDKYWKKRTLAPSALIMYLGVKGKLPSLTHHNLLFSKDWKKNFGQIFDDPQWPSDPSLYICAPSKTDPNVAPKGHENLFVLVPIAAGLDYTEGELERYADTILQTMEGEMGLAGLREKIVYKKLFSVKDFSSRYNSYQGTALGLAHTLRQTAIFRPNNISKKVKNLYYTGAGTNPGIGMPKGEWVGLSRRSSSFRSTSSLMTCSQRQASS
jgi:phytoene desaturase